MWPEHCEGGAERAQGRTTQALKGLGGSGKCSEAGPQSGASVNGTSCWPRGEGVTCERVKAGGAWTAGR